MAEIITIRDDGSRDVGLLCEDESLTKQSMRDECDINRILKKFERTGLISHMNANPGFYDDVSEVPDYQGALAVVRQADQMFMSLPAQLRSRFDHDPAKFLAFVADPANAEELVTLGLRVKSVVQTAPVQVPPDPTKAAV